MHSCPAYFSLPRLLLFLYSYRVYTQFTPRSIPFLSPSCSPVSSLNTPSRTSLPPTSCHATTPLLTQIHGIPFLSLSPSPLPPPSHLNASWSPGYELCQLSLPDALQALVHLGGVHLSLDDVQDGDVAVVVSTITWSRHHHIFWLREAGYILKVSQDTRPNCIKKSPPLNRDMHLASNYHQKARDSLDLGRH